MNEDGTYTTTVERQSFEVNREDKTVKLNSKVSTVKFISKNVVLGCGGRQKIPNSIYKKYEIN